MPKGLLIPDITCDHICIECGKHENDRYNGWAGKIIQDHQMCKDCSYWQEKVEIKDDPRVARVKGRHYWVGDVQPKGTPSMFRGFGGSGFMIKFNDGREVETFNLRHNGHIPDRFKDRLPDNAEFVYYTMAIEAEDG